jgi:tryprostatin B 6-hydroxylase
MADQIAQTCATLAVLGVISHLSVFIRLNSVDSAPRLVLFALTAPFVGVLALNTLLRLSINKAILTVAAWFFSYVGAAFVSMTLYRTCFHPLRSYPGTFWDQVTQFHLVSKIWKRVDHFRQIDKLHKQYGDYVRVGPNLLSVTDPNIVQAVHASGSKFRKGEWYEPGKPMVTLHQMTDPAMHDRRRRHGWDKV